MKNYKTATKEWDYLSQFYTEAELDSYAKGSEAKIIDLYNQTQPKKVKIGSLKNRVSSNLLLVSSPDGWVPVVDCVEKIKDEMVKCKFKSGIEVVSSHDHLFQKSDGTWVFAKDLVIGEFILSHNGIDIVEYLEFFYKKTKVYDLSINSTNHRYYTNGICSHNSGKSLFLQNLAVNWIQGGLSGAYITLELNEGLTGMRIDSMVTGTSTREVFKDIDNVELKVKMYAKTYGKFQLKYLPAQSTINDVRSYCRELQIKTGNKLDFLCVDYLDLLMPVSVKVSAENLFVKDKYVAEELRNLAKELNVLMVTASQLNRGAVEEIEFDHSHIAGGISKINTADNVFGIFTSRSMREKGQYQIQLMKTRSSSGIGQKIELDFNVETLRITDPDIDENNIGPTTPSPNEIMAKLKPTPYTDISQLGSTDSEENSAPVKHIVADVQGSKLRQMLNSLKK